MKRPFFFKWVGGWGRRKGAEREGNGGRWKALKRVNQRGDTERALGGGGGAPVEMGIETGGVGRWGGGGGEGEESDKKT